MSAQREDIDETFGLKRTQRESDADRIISAPHDHQWPHRRIALGSAPWHGDDVRSLVSAGITHVLNVSGTNAEYLYRDTSIMSMHNPTDDDGAPKPAEWFHRGISFAQSALATKGSRLLVHCAAGVNRSPAMVYAILRSVMRVSRQHAWQMIAKARPQANPRYVADAERAVCR